MTIPAQLGQGRYVVRGVLGDGAQGVTLDATDANGRPVAIKRFDVRGARSWKDVELAERETRVLATLDHSLLPRYVEHFEEDGALYLVMEKVEGESLDAILRREGALPEPEVRRFLRCADRALSYLHGRSAPIVHRDIKPRNVIRRPNGDYVLVDFGVVAERLGQATQRGGSTVVGTAGFMAPEQLQGRATPTTDVYAVGATALVALTARDPDSLPHRGLRVDVRSALAGRAVSTELTLALEAMLEPDPSARPADVGSALEPPAARIVSVPPGPANAPAAALPDEDAMVKSLRRLVWALWGLSWAIVMPLSGRHEDGAVVFQFMTLASVLVVTWHKGFLLRQALRRIAGPRGAVATDAARLRVATEERARVQVSQPAFRAGTELEPTQVEHAPPKRMAR